MNNIQQQIIDEVAKTIKGLLVANDWGIELVNEYIKTDGE